jgi:hypothetical protein
MVMQVDQGYGIAGLRKEPFKHDKTGSEGVLHEPLQPSQRTGSL